MTAGNFLNCAYQKVHLRKDSEKIEFKVFSRNYKRNGFLVF